MTMIGRETAGEIRTGTRMTEEEFERWALREQVRAEWVNGEVQIMSPANVDHWDIGVWLTTLMRMHATKHDLGKVGSTDLLMRMENRRSLPDVVFVAKAHLPRLKRTYLEGPADLIVEVVSPDSESRDRREKYEAYQSGGVAEYWIIDPATSTAEFHHLSNGEYKPMEIKDGVIRSVELTGFWLKVAWLWERPLAPDFEVAKRIGII